MEVPTLQKWQQFTAIRPKQRLGVVATRIYIKDEHIAVIINNCQDQKPIDHILLCRHHQP